MRGSNKAAAVLGFVLVCFTIVGESADTAVWENISNGFNETFVHSITITTKDRQAILAGTSKGLYLSSDENNFIPLFSIPGDQTNVNHIHFDNTSETILMATDSGLYKSSDHGKKFDRLFYSSEPTENKCLAVFSDESGIFLGTQRGLFYQRTGQTRWSKAFEQLSMVPVYQILKDDSYLYFVTNKKVFRMKTNNDKPVEIFSSQHSDVQEPDNTTEIIREDKTVNYVSLVGKSEVIISAENGLSYSSNYGDAWQRFDLGVVPYNEINAILPVSTQCSNEEGPCLRFFAATDRGVFFYEHGKWTSLYQGMTATRVNSLSIYEGQLVIAATENGIYKLPLKETLALFNPTINHLSANIDYEEFKNRLNYEPTIEEIQRLAIEYAEVHPDKIKEWRKGAKKKAWFPSLDIGFDGGRDWTRSDSVFGSSSSGGTHYVGPDDKSSGEDLGWDVSLSWDLADVVWNSDQTTIDGRSKLMVELREDILNQVTRLYYERRRLQAELQGAGEDQRTVFDRKMRIDELTALIDGLTGGEFSLHIKERKSTDKVTSHKDTGHKLLEQTRE